MADADPRTRPVDEATLVSDIDRTRAELARTIDAITELVSPKRNMERAMDQLRQRVSQVDPFIAAGAAAAFAVTVTALFLWRRRKR